MERNKASRGVLRRVIIAASIGTAFEWYDFFLFGALASVLAKHFFSSVPPSAAFLLALGTFAAAPLMRPVGALIFGRLGDRKGRKIGFLLTVSIMGAATFLIGILPTYGHVGAAAPILLVALRLLQGVALGGEYGGAATYVAEHASPRNRGWLTSWIQSSAAFGLIAALGVTFMLRWTFGEAAFESWAWRLAFLLSVVPLALSLRLRLRLNESPEFMLMSLSDQTSRAPLREAFLEWPNLKRVLIALFGVTMAQGAVWYCAFFYSQFFLEKVLKVDPQTVTLLFLLGTLVSVALYVFFGWAADRIGRKPLMAFGMMLAAVAFVPGFHALTRAANPALAEAMERSPVEVAAAPADCTAMFDPVGKRKPVTGCDVARRTLADLGISYARSDAPAGSAALISIGAETISVPDLRQASPEQAAAEAKAFSKLVAASVETHGYPAKADPDRLDFWRTLSILLVLITAASALYGPQAAWLVEMFPTRIRYSAMSLPLHIGGGWFGGLLPAVAFSLVAASGDIYMGLWWPVAVAAVGAVTTILVVPETLRGRPRLRLGLRTAGRLA